MQRDKPRMVPEIGSRGDGLAEQGVNQSFQDKPAPSAGLAAHERQCSGDGPGRTQVLIDVAPRGLLAAAYRDGGQDSQVKDTWPWGPIH